MSDEQRDIEFGRPFPPPKPPADPDPEAPSGAYPTPFGTGAWPRRPAEEPPLDSGPSTVSFSAVAWPPPPAEEPPLDAAPGSVSGPSTTSFGTGSWSSPLDEESPLDASPGPVRGLPSGSFGTGSWTRPPAEEPPPGSATGSWSALPLEEPASGSSPGSFGTGSWSALSGEEASSGPSGRSSTSFGTGSWSSPLDEESPLDASPGPVRGLPSGSFGTGSWSALSAEEPSREASSGSSATPFGTGAWARPPLETASDSPGGPVPTPFGTGAWEGPPGGEQAVPFAEPVSDASGEPSSAAAEEPGDVASPRSGRRARRAARRAESPLLQAVRRFAAHRYGTAALILLAAASLYGAAELSRPGPAPAQRGEVVPVEEALAVCPDAAKAEITVASTGRGGGEAVLRDPVGKVVATLDEPGTVWTAGGARTARRTGPLVVDAKGAHAAGLGAVQVTREKRGLSGVACGVPATDHWFVSPGPGEGTVDLYLTNAEDIPATVDLHAISDQGGLATTDGKSLEVPGQASRIIRIGRSVDGLGAVAEGTGVIALRVTATSGRVAAAVRTTLGSRGVDWVPAAAAPARELVLPGIPPGGGRRTLYVGAPGEADARVRVKVITEDGSFAPAGQDVLEVPADTVMTLDLETSLGGRAGAVVLTSERELVAGLQAGGEDVSYGAAAVPLGFGSTVGDARKGSILLLTAPKGAAKVRVTPLGGNGPQEAREVALPAGGAVEVPVDAGAVRVEPLPGSGPVYGARFLTVKSGRSKTATLLPLGPSPQDVRLPAVGGSLTAVLTDSGGR